MRHRSITILTTLAVIALLALAIGDASARSFSVTERNFELIWNNALTGKTKLKFVDASNSTIECAVTMLGRYASNTIAKRTETNQGTINHGEVEGCVGGSLTLRTETMPWTLRYGGFTGILPAIETITTHLLNAQLRIEESGGHVCTFASEPNHPLVVIREGGSLENMRVDETRTIPLTGEFGLCTFVSPGHFAGRGLILNLPRTANVTVTLI